MGTRKTIQTRHPLRYLRIETKNPSITGHPRREGKAHFAGLVQSYICGSLKTSSHWFYILEVFIEYLIHFCFEINHDNYVRLTNLIKNLNRA